MQDGEPNDRLTQRELVKQLRLQSYHTHNSRKAWGQ
jgi:hypothetical protein